MGRRRPSPTPTPPPSTLNGTEGNDAITWDRATAGTIDGRGGVDTLTILLGSLNTDVVMSGAVGSGLTAQLSTGLVFRNIETLVIRTGGGNDRLFGGAGNDYFATGTGNDIVTGGAGNDWFDLAQGANTATGGLGADTFFLLNDGHVIITDFSTAQGDKIFFDLNGMDIPTAWGLANGFFRFSDTAEGALLEVDFDSTGVGFDWTVVALLQGVTVAALTPEAFVV